MQDFVKVALPPRDANPIIKSMRASIPMKKPERETQCGKDLDNWSRAGFLTAAATCRHRHQHQQQSTTTTITTTTTPQQQQYRHGLRILNI